MNYVAYVAKSQAFFMSNDPLTILRTLYRDRNARSGCTERAFEDTRGEDKSEERRRPSDIIHNPLKSNGFCCDIISDRKATEIVLPAQTLVFCDFETRNVGGCDLTKAGAWRYATDPATEILCFGYRVGGADHSWDPAGNSREPLERLATGPAAAFVSFGGFEQVIWRTIMVGRHGFPPIPAERWIDLRAICSAFALPRALDKALAALGLPVEKDKAGQRLVRRLSKRDRRTDAYPELTPAIVEQVAEYNRVDVLALELMHARGLGALQPGERAVWLLDQKINARGIAIDVGFVEAAKQIADQVMGEAVEEFARLTHGVLPTQVLKIREWLRDNRCALPNLEAETIEEALESAGLPDVVRRVLEIRQIVASASLKKLDAMLAVVEPDGRARGLLQYHGATTGRWSGQLIQPQNFPRPTLKEDVDPEELAAAVKTGGPEALRRWGKPVDVLVSSLRCALTAAEGELIGAGDFSMIEACVLLALAGQKDKCELIAQGADIYRDMAATIYGLDRAQFMGVPEDQLSPEETEQRRTGKNAVLGCGYQIGAENFHRRFCRHVENGKELAARIVAVYRASWAPKVPQLWRDLERAARQAMLRPGAPITASCGVGYRLTTQAGLPCLVCALPNGKLLHYVNAKLDGQDKFGRPRWTYNAYRQGQWCTIEPYGGQLTENAVSALARELLVHAMFALEGAGYPIVFTVHDEIVVERADVAKEDIERIMSERPAWAEKLGVPVRVKARAGKRYMKETSVTPAKGPARPRAPVSPSVEAMTPAKAQTPPLGVLGPPRTLIVLFAGGGMAELGFGPDWSVILANDWSPTKAAAYVRNFGADHFRGGNVAALTTADVPGVLGVDCLWMSPPCQATSAAGGRKGLDGERSSAFWSAWRLVLALVAEGRAPRTLVYENPVGATAERDGEGKSAVETVREAFETAGYGCATFTVDALAFVPQSRKRVFVVGAYGVPGANVQAVVDLAMKALDALPKRVVALNDVLDFSSRYREYSPDVVAHHLAMLSPASVELIAEARGLRRPIAFAFARRTRYPGGVRMQTVEIRKGDIANALKLPSSGGSSHQFLIIVDGDKTYIRALDPHDAAKLMGLPASYELPSDDIAALDLCGDGVVVDVVRHIARHIVEPLLAIQSMARAAE
jgi:DNA polymerase